MLLSRVSGSGDRLMPARHALRLATNGGAKVLKRDDIGVLEIGRRADIAFFSLSGIAGAGTEHDPVAALVLAPPRGATHVMVDGRFAVWDGHLMVDEASIVSEHQALVRRITRRIKK
jgi:cytosine/adenosine deaminase-related metal-dependent hydrolase